MAKYFYSIGPSENGALTGMLYPIWPSQLNLIYNLDHNFLMFLRFERRTTPTGKIIMY